ncbi:hypothetical protein K4L44_14480 [Halosquirtibacter laminarini]|uniref:Uncharacterized protein n=1 Tax=Halosquirtibacter laminarini TaxID=3374600 RepID=A0AC61NHM7_9BACT|nr:hypothetical protein K4L44_14480 [Prolixibacteraceae bacterium]
MMRLFTSSIIVLLISGSVFAQDPAGTDATTKSTVTSTGTAPFPGAMHIYSITTEETATESWSVKMLSGSAWVDATFTNAKGETTPVAVYADENDAATAADRKLRKVKIDWNPEAPVANYYYVQVETVKDGCKNLRMLPIQITQSTFDMNLAVVGTRYCYAEQVAPIIEGNTTVVYDQGFANIVYNFSVTGVNDIDAWETTISYVGVKGATDEAEPKTNGDIYLTSLVAATGYTDKVTIEAFGDNTYKIKGTGPVTDVKLNAVIDNRIRYVDNDKYDSRAEIVPVLKLANQTIVEQSVAEVDAANDKTNITINRHQNGAITVER